MKNEISIVAFAAIAGIAVAYISIRQFNKKQSIKQLKNEITSDLLSSSLDIINKQDQDLLIKEQLSRNNSFLGQEKQNLINNSFCIVVGLGGVGSHCAHMLLRSGVQHLRLVDFDQVTLSSLNRHAVATREDVGIPKVDCMKSHLLKIIPTANIEACAQMFNIDSAADLLDGNPDFVIDCIDNIQTKVELLKFCVDNGIKVISSMGSGAKCDPTRIQIADISETFEDPLARATRKGLRLKGITHGIPVVYSTEKPGTVGLIPLDEERVKDAHEFASLPDFRVRILPVLGTLPALFGNTLASYVITQLAQWPIEPLAFKARDRIYGRIYRDMHLKEIKMFNNDSLLLSIADVGFIFDEIWRGRSCLSGSFEKLSLYRWDKSKPLNYGNVICFTKQEAESHEKLDISEFQSYYSQEFLSYVNKRFEKEIEENSWRLYY